MFFMLNFIIQWRKPVLILQGSLGLRMEVQCDLFILYWLVVYPVMIHVTTQLCFFCVLFLRLKRFSWLKCCYIFYSIRIYGMFWQLQQFNELVISSFNYFSLNSFGVTCLHFRFWYKKTLKCQDALEKIYNPSYYKRVIIYLAVIKFFLHYLSLVNV